MNSNFNAAAGAIVAALMTVSPAAHAQEAVPIEVGVRPLYLIHKMAESPLKQKLLSCAGQPVVRTAFSIGHRGAPLQFPEHTVESNLAAAWQGAGVLECDVAFTADKELVCRHAQNDLHTTTNILETELAAVLHLSRSLPRQWTHRPAAECTLGHHHSPSSAAKPKMDASQQGGGEDEGIHHFFGTSAWRNRPRPDRSVDS